MAMCAQAVLAAATVAAQGLADALMPTGPDPSDTTRTPLCNFFLTIADSGERKTAVADLAIKAIVEYQEELFSRALGGSNGQQVTRHEPDTSLPQARAEEGETSPPAIDQTIIFQSPTMDGFIKANAQGQPSIAIWSDEAGSFLQGHSFSNAHKDRVAATVNSIWHGKTIERIRATEKTPLRLRGRRVTLALSVQALVGVRFLNDDGLGEYRPAREVSHRATEFNGRNTKMALHSSRDRRGYRKV